MNKLIYLFFLTCFSILILSGKNNLYAQPSQEANEYNKVSIASPTAGSLAKFVDIPVSLHTGIPEIKIPLYSLTSGQLSVPISMSYHASGLKTLEPAGWVGAGWALNAGGVITRSVRGTPDEKGTVNEFQKFGFFSDYGYRTHLVSSGISGGSPGADSTADYQRYISGEKDSEPDLFFFNFGGYSGKFYFNDDRTPMLLPEQDIKIEYVYNYSSSESIQAFILTTPDGVKYYFGATPSVTDVDPVEYTKVFTDQNGLGWDKVLSSWYLNKIVSSDGTDIINLTYRSSSYSFYTLSITPVAQGGDGYKLVRNFVTGVELESMTSSNGQVSFIPATVAREDLSNFNTNGVEGVNTSAKALGRIDVLQKSGQTLLKRYRFVYDYFIDNTSSVATNLSVVTTDRKRLKLVSIQEESGTGVTNPPYQFTYFNELVPRRMSFAQDHWGFINGITTNGQKLIGTYYKTSTTPTAVVVPGADRDAKWPAMRGGTLSKITFPTGGFNIYDYEPNQSAIDSLTSTNGERTYRESLGAGYDGGQVTKTAFKFFTVDFHQFVFKLTNGNAGGLAYLNVYDSNNTRIDRLQANNNQISELTRNYTPGTYKFEVVKENAYSGSDNGAMVTIYELAGTLVSSNAMVGGLRIKTIRQNSGGDNPEMVTNYEYTDGPNNRSTGVLFGKPTIAQVFRNDIYRNYWDAEPGSAGGINANGCPTTPASQLPFLISPGSIRPMATTQGSHIGYQKVTTRQTGNGYSVSLFNVDGENNVQHDDVVNRHIVTTPGSCGLDIPNSPAVPEPNSFKRGQLEYRANYTNSGVLLDDMTYSSEYQDNPMTTPAFVISANPAINNGTLSVTWYDQKTARKIKETEIKKSYNTFGNVETKIESFFSSPYHHQLTKRLTTSSSGEILETRYAYVPDYILPSVDGLSDGLANFNSQLASVNYTFDALIANCSGSVVCQRNAWLNYDVDLCHKRRDFINYRITNFTGPNNTYITRLQQALNIVSAELKPIIDMRMQNRFALIETVNLKNSKIQNATLNTYDYFPGSGNKIYLSKISKLESLVPQSTFTYTGTAANNVNLTKDPRYIPKVSFNYKAGKLAEEKLTDDLPSAYLWGYNNEYPVAAVKNAQVNEVMFSGFEESDPTVWGYGISAYDQAVKHSGNVSARVDAYGTSEITVMKNMALTLSLTSAKRYHYSAWIFSNGPVADVFLFMKRTGETAYYSYVDNVTTAVRGKWVLVEKDFLVPADVTQLNIRLDNNGIANGGNKVWFDDVRIYPSEGQMTTYTYDPLVGMTSMTDTKNDATYYEYDELQRLASIKDEDGSIVNNYAYHYIGQATGGGTSPSPTFSNVAKSASFTRNNCNTGSTGSSVTFTVPQGFFTSTISQAAVDQQAQDYANANGQSYANANGTCSAAMVNLTLTNTTGEVGIKAYIPNLSIFDFPQSGSLSYQVPAGTYDIYINAVNAPILRRIVLTGTSGGDQTIIASQGIFEDKVLITGLNCKIDVSTN